MDSAMLLLVCFLLVMSSAAGGAAWYFLLRPKKYTIAEVEAHNKSLTTAYGYWVVYKGAVYDLTPVAKEAEAQGVDPKEAVPLVVMGIALGGPSDAEAEKEIMKYMTKVGDLDPSGGTTMHLS